MREALQFSAHLRTKHSKDTPTELVETFIDEVSASIVTLTSFRQLHTRKGPVTRAISVHMCFLDPGLECWAGSSPKITGKLS